MSIRLNPDQRKEALREADRVKHIASGIMGVNGESVRERPGMFIVLKKNLAGELQIKTHFDGAKVRITDTYSIDSKEILGERLAVEDDLETVEKYEVGASGLEALSRLLATSQEVPPATARLILIHQTF